MNASEGIRALLGALLARPQVEKVDGRDVLCMPNADGSYGLPVEVPLRPFRADALILGALDALVEYLAANRDELARERLVVHVVNPRRVELLGPLGAEFRERERLLVVEQPSVFGVPHTLLAGFKFGDFVPLEAAIIALLAGFVPPSVDAAGEPEAANDRDDVVRLLSKVTGEQVRVAEDDGMSQQVQVRQGISRVSDQPQTIKARVTLRPWRTFREVAQPRSEFVVRLQADSGGFTVALIEADGATWIREAVGNVAAYLREKLKDASVDVPVLA